jgi:flagellar biosynthesis protein FliQ
MADVANSLYIQTMQTALALAIPVVIVVGCVGVVVSLAQTIVGIQDQNLSFGPKIVALAVILAAGASSAVTLLDHLLLAAIAALPHLAG